MTGPLVFIDTNALYSDPYCRGPEMDVLLRMSSHSHIALAISEVTIRELQRQQQEKFSGAVAYLQGAGQRISDQLAKLGENPARYRVRVPDFRELDPDELARAKYQDVRQRLARLGVEILPLPDVGHEELIMRDLASRPPFDRSGKGYRDALIWHSFLDRWEMSGFDLAFLVTDDAVFGRDGDLAPQLWAEVPDDALLVRMGSLGELLANDELNAQSPSELNESGDADALSEALRIPGAYERTREAVREAVSSAIIALAPLTLSRAQRDDMQIRRQFEDVTVVWALAAIDEFEWNLYDQLDGETQLGRGAMVAQVEFSALVHQTDAAVLADDTLRVEAWHGDSAEVQFMREAQFVFDVRVDSAGSVESLSFTDLRARQ